VKYLNRIFRKLIMLIFLGLKIFYQIFIKKILTFVLTCWKKFWLLMVKKKLKGELNLWQSITIHELVKIISSQVGASNFKSIFESHVVMGCKLSFFWYQVALVSNSREWNELIRRGKVDLNLRMDSFQSGEIDAGENQA